MKPLFSLFCAAWLCNTAGILAQAPNLAPAPSPETQAATPETTSTPRDFAPNATLETSDLEEFENISENAQELITEALALTKRNLTYRYGSADPEQGGMDCSGTIYYLLKEQGIKEPPRTASDQYVWVRKLDLVQPVVSNKESTFELEDLKPGDLLFWTGTYGVERDPPVTHTMIYLGREKKTGKRVMVGASDGRSYDGKKRNGVSVFDFKLPSASRSPENSGPRFVGYASVPFPEKSDSKED